MSSNNPLGKQGAGAILAKSMKNVGQKAFVPENYSFQDRAELLAYIAENPLSQLFSADGGALQVTTAPLIYCEAPSQPSSETRELNFIGHIAKRNNQCSAIKNGASAVAVFVGPGAYVSPRWFAVKKTAPTWNYVSVQLHGQLEFVEGPEDTLAVLEKTVAHMEAQGRLSATDEPWTMGEMAPGLMDQLLLGIVAFRFKVHVMEGIQRLNQDKDIIDMQQIMAGLSRSPQRGAQDIIRLMVQKVAAAGR